MDTRRESRRLGVLSGGAPVWLAVVLVVLVLVDGLLVTMALGETSPQQNGTAGPIPTFSSSPAPGTSSVSPTPTATAGRAVGTRMLSSVDGQEAWRASSDGCDGSAPTLEHSTDSGATWKSVALESNVTSLLSIESSETGLSILASVGDSCTPTVRTSTDDGTTWTAGAPGDAGAGLNSDGVVLSAGTVASPCADPVDAYQGESTVVVTCEKQLQWRAGAGGWVPVPLSGVRSLADNGDSYSLARVGTASCGGVQIESMTAIGVTPQTTTTPIGCDAGVDTTQPIALSRSGQDVWLWTGNTVKVSPDGGVTW